MKQSKNGTIVQPQKENLRAKSKYAIDNKMEFKSTLPDEQTILYGSFISGYSFSVVPFFEGSDLFPTFLCEVAEQSPTKGACVESKVRLVFGNGIEFVTEKDSTFFADKKEKVSLSPAANEAMKLFCLDSSISNDKKNIGWLSSQILKDWFTTGNVTVLLQKTKVGGKSFFKYSFHAAKYVRRTKVNNSNGKRYVVITPKFTYYDTAAEIIVAPEYPEWEAKDGVERSAITVQNMFIGREYYGLPTSITSIYHQLLEAENQKYNLEETQNKWLGKLFIEAVEPVLSTAQELNQLNNMLAEAFTNKASDNPSVKKRHFVYREVADKEQFTKITELNKTLDAGYSAEMLKEAERSILKSELWHRSLLGVHDEGGILGNSKERSEAYKAAYSTVIVPAREMLSGVLDIVYREFCNYTKTEVQGSFWFEDNKRFILGDEAVQAFMTIDEVRALNGLPPLPDKAGEVLSSTIRRATI
jgi:hypothetical protein